MTLQDVATEKEVEIKPLMIKLATTDPKSIVRADAIDFLAKNYSGNDLTAIYKNKLSDSSSLVVGTALSSIAKYDAPTALAKAKELENEKSDNMRYAIMDLYANYGSDANNDYFLKQKIISRALKFWIFGTKHFLKALVQMKLL